MKDEFKDDNDKDEFVTVKDEYDEDKTMIM